MDNNKSLIGRIRDYMAHRREKQRARRLAFLERHYEKTTLPAGTPLRRMVLMDDALPTFWITLPSALLMWFLVRDLSRQVVRKRNSSCVGVWRRRSLF